MPESQDKPNWAAENKIVPFPIGIKTAEPGSLEYYFNVLPRRDNFYAYDELPDIISSNSVDQYLTWLADLTKVDSNHRERGTFIILRNPEGKLIYPVNPVIGEERTVDPSPHMSEKPKIFAPLMRTHSHPSQGTFSRQDLLRAIGSKDFIAEGLGTQGRNFILFRTDQSTMAEPERVESFKDDLEEVYEDIAKAYIDLVRSLPLHPDQIQMVAKRALEMSVSEFGTDHIAYMVSHATSLLTADEYKLGFYYSDKDGIFKRFTADSLNQIHQQVSDVWQRAFASMAGESDK